MEIDSQLSRADLSGRELTKLTRERASIADIVDAYREYRGMKEDREAAKEMLQDPDPDAKAMAKEELDILETGIADKEQELQLLTLPRDPNDDKNVILEVRAGTGGDEAALFAADLMRMYIRYAELRGWKTEMMSSTESSVGWLQRSGRSNKRRKSILENEV